MATKEHDLITRCSNLAVTVELAEGIIETVALQAAASIREHIVVPLCDKHNVMFMAGNNDWFFCMQGDRHGVLRDGWGGLGTKLRAETDAVCSILRKPVLGSREVGIYVENYRPASFR